MTAPISTAFDPTRPNRRWNTPTVATDPGLGDAGIPGMPLRGSQPPAPTPQNYNPGGGVAVGPMANPPANPSPTSYGMGSAPNAYVPAGNAYGGSSTITGINPAQDLRSQQIAPSYGAGGFAAGADQYGMQAANALGSGTVAPTNYGNLQSLIDQIRSAGANAATSGAGQMSPELQALRGKYTDSLNNLVGPDRNALAGQAFQLLQDQSRPAYEQELRQVGAKNAALGRIGSGLTTNDLTSVQNRRDQMLAQAQQGLSLDAAGQTLNDKLAASQGIGAGYDLLGRQGLNASIASQNASLGGVGALQNAFQNALQLANLQQGEGQANRQYGLQRAGALSGLSDQAFGQGTGLRNELRGERGYQTDASQQGINNALTQRLTEEQLLNSGVNRGIDTTNLYNQLGNQGVDQYGQALGNQANTAAQQSAQAYGGVGDLLAQYLQSQAGTRPATAARPTYGGTFGVGGKGP